MPLTVAGKADRAALAALIAEAPAAAPEPAQLSGLEALLFDLWRRDLPQLADIDTDFFAAGGDSLRAMGAARRIAAQLGRPCPAVQFYQTPTVRTMAQALQARAERSGPQRHGDGPLTIFALPPLPGTEHAYAVLARALPQASIHVAAFEDSALSVQLEAWADACAELPAAPVILGYSGGGKLALALAARLERAGLRLPAVVLIDTWDLRAVGSAARAAIEAGAARLSDHALGAAYRARIDAFDPEHMVAAPLHHLLAGAGADEAPAGATRDWRRLAATSYSETMLPGAHHDILAAPHVAATAAAFMAVLETAAGPLQAAGQT